MATLRDGFTLEERLRFFRYFKPIIFIQELSRTTPLQPFSVCAEFLIFFEDFLVHFLAVVDSYLPNILYPIPFFLKDLFIHSFVHCCRSNLSLSTLNHQIHLIGSNVDQIFINETERWIVHQTFPSTQCFFFQFSILDSFCGRLIDHNAKRNVYSGRNSSFCSFCGQFERPQC